MSTRHRGGSYLFFDEGKDSFNGLEVPNTLLRSSDFLLCEIE